jgi:hypothetical protein
VAAPHRRGGLRSQGRASRAQRSYHVTPLDRDDLSGVDWPSSRDPNAAIGACVVRRSRWPIDDQVKLIQLADQIDAEPSASAYQRHFVDPADPSCFTEQGCSPLVTDNDITRDNAALTVSYLLHKHLRWVRLAPDRWAIAARSFTDRPFAGQKDGTALDQSYSIDVFLAQSDARTVRYQCSWSETALGVDLDDGLQLAVLVDGVDRALGASDDAISKHFH